MGFLDNFLGNNKPKFETKSFWNSIESQEDIDRAVEESHQHKVAIFKHSTRCFISKTVLKNFEREIADSDKDIAYFIIDILSHRELSNEIAERFCIEHQSPQLIILENGLSVNDASHQSISLSLV